MTDPSPHIPPVPATATAVTRRPPIVMPTPEQTARRARNLAVVGFLDESIDALAYQRRVVAEEGERWRLIDDPECRIVLQLHAMELERIERALSAGAARLDMIRANMMVGE